MEIKVLLNLSVQGSVRLAGVLDDVRLQRLQELYEMVLSIQCKKSCHECCGAHPWFPIEAVNINKFMLKNNIKERHADSLLDMCPYIEGDGCLIYPVRPILCRLFGVVKHGNYVADMECPFVPKPERMLSEEEADKILDEVKIL